MFGGIIRGVTKKLVRQSSYFEVVISTNSY